MERIIDRIFRMCRFRRACITLFYVILLGSPGHMTLPSGAQAECGVIRATPLRVQNQTGVEILREAANCTDGGSLDANWLGDITLDSPIVIASGVFISITGEDTLAEVQGGSQTRMFEVSRGGGLTLTQMKLSGGTAENGGAIYSDSAALTLDSCMVYGNEATDGDGGAVWADGGNVTVVGGQFLDNNASRYGGAVAATGARLFVQEGSIFEGNKGLVGGALYYSGVAEAGLAVLATPCFLSDAVFTANTATGQSEETALLTDFSEGVDGGGAVAFLFASVNITNSVFGGNYAQFSGGALVGGNGTDITVNGCKFDKNMAEEVGGAIAGASMTLGGGTQLTNNTSGSSGGAVFGWSLKGLIIFNDVICSQNTAGGYGGCLRSGGTGYVNTGTVMHDNTGLNGGCISADDGGELNVVGGDFMCTADRQGGFLRVGDDTAVKITGGVIANNVAGDRGGAIFCGRYGGSTLHIEGGTFMNNTALELGGVISASGESTSVRITGGMFTNNSAKLFGGFLHLISEASLSCEGATVENNYAGSEGGGIYARTSPWVNSSCDLIGNQSPQGAALYLSGVESVTLENHVISDNLALSGSVVNLIDTTVIANGVSFTSSVGLQEDSSNRAVQSDKNSVLTATDCAFDGWLGDTVIYHENAEAGSLYLDSCDFSGSSTTMVVFSLNSNTTIRNAIADDTTFRNAGRINNSVVLVNRVSDCSSANICGPGRCLESALGVLCECLDVGTCLDDGGQVSLDVKTPPANETYSPDAVSFELLASSALDGTTYAIWELVFDAEDLSLDVTPSSGLLPPGANVTVVVTGTPTNQGVNGNLASRFNLTSVGIAGSVTNAEIAREVNSTYYLCSTYKYAKLVTAEDNGYSCEQCMCIIGGEGVDCNSPGATLVALPIRQGYWRSSQESLVVHTCGNSEACTGATEIVSSDTYCADGYQGPYCAVCSAGYGRGVSDTCHSCDDNTKTRLIISASAIASVVVLLLLVIFAVVFLIGGLDGVEMVRKSVTSNVSKANNMSSVWPEAEPTWLDGHLSRRRARSPNSHDTIPPAFDFTWERPHRGDVRDISHISRNVPQTCPGRDDVGVAYVRPAGAFGRTNVTVGLSHEPASHAGELAMPERDHGPLSAVAGTAVAGELENHGEDLVTKDGGDFKFCGLGINLRTWASRLPMDKFKILVVVWQIQSVFASITMVEFPASYSMFLSWIGVLSFDIAHILSASCILPSFNFYASLLVTTLTPLVVAAGLVVTYQMAMRRAGIGSAGVIARSAAWSRHVAVGLLLTFLVFTSASTVVFKAFVCDDEVGNGKSYLRADYSIMCGSSSHTLFKAYAMIMILVYPIGIPVLYAVILWKKREMLNPRRDTTALSELDGTDATATRIGSADRSGFLSSFLRKTLNSQTDDEESWKDLQDSKEREKARRENPELTPFVFLWKDFGPGLYYYEVIECGRRILLTGVLVFIAPNSSTQIAAACVFAFGTLLGFELMRPHLDTTNTWLYRMGCVVIFLSYFLALLISVDAVGEGHYTAFAVILVVINVLLVVAVFTTSWLAVTKPREHFKDDDVTQM